MGNPVYYTFLFLCRRFCISYFFTCDRGQVHFRTSVLVTMISVQAPSDLNFWALNTRPHPFCYVFVFRTFFGICEISIIESQSHFALWQSVNKHKYTSRSIKKRQYANLLKNMLCEDRFIKLTSTFK